MNRNMDRHGELGRLTQSLVASVEAAQAHDAPFYHLRFERVFPDDIYSAMLREFPGAQSYRALPGRSNDNIQADGSSTRVKMDLFPEYTRGMSPTQKDLWRLVGGALRSDDVRQAFRRKLAPGLKRRFGDAAENVGLFPIPVLMRDVPNYRIPPHTDTRWKGITVQFYLPPDDSTSEIGTIFHGREPDGSFTHAAKMPFVPNSGYAFAVGDNTWHSADPVGPHVKTRDSILHTYFVDERPLEIVRNRAKRVGNFVLHEARRVVGR